MLADRVLDHVVVGGDDESGVLQEQEETDGLEGRDRGLRKTAVEIVDQDHQRDPQLLEDVLERIPESLDLFRRRLVGLRIQESACSVRDLARRGFGILG